MNPAGGSLRHPVVTVILVAMALAVGVHALVTMPRMEDPSITIRTGLVVAAYPGATAEQVEKQVTKTLERHILRYPEVRKEKTYSTSRPGLAFVNVELEDRVKDADAFWSKLRHELNVVRGTELPREVRGPIVNSDFGDTVALLIAVHGPHYGARELRDHAEKIEAALRGVREVGKLTLYGEQSEEVVIAGDSERMAQYAADPRRVIDALQQRNVIGPSGTLDAETARVPFRTTGAFTTEDQVRRVLIDVSPRTGQTVTIGDVAEVTRRYQDPRFVVRYDGEASVLIAVEMQKGRNIVELGTKVDAALAGVRPLLPPDLALDVIANQPAVVQERMSSLFREFLLAIGSVVLVTILLLPFRVALIAALAIPVTLCTTVGVLNAMGLELHQVSIATLILVLGIVVDDAIVIADNYVDLLDRGVPRKEAAGRAVTEVLIPVLTATLTIIASFLPLLVLTGSAGEFISALPITAATALVVSFVVAVVFTPLTCRTFIRKGLHASAGAAGGGRPRRRGPLEVLQAVYDRVIVVFMRHKSLALLLGAGGIAAGVLLLGLVPQQFFPAAERAQCVVDVWMPQGTRIEATDAVMKRIEARLAAEKGVAHVAAFVGQSAPRFYYNVNPQQPDTAYGQLIVNTASEKDTQRLVPFLRRELARIAPEALVIVKDLQQGMVLEAPVEIRIAGDDLETLRRLGDEVRRTVAAHPAAQLVHVDWFEPSCRVDVDLDTELAARLGVTHALVSNVLAGGFDGAPVGTLWEGDRPVSIVLRLDAGHRATFEDARDAYVTSPLTHASVPVRAVATFTPEWQPSRIVRRNGIRTLTVRAFPAAGHYASEILADVGPRVRASALPAGYHVTLGGEIFNRQETMPGMLRALSISLVAIFLVMLVQFRTVSAPLTVMASIPLALFGAALGLLVTHNTFGFTAFMGLISLSGIVVRNAIILLEYVEERVATGRSVGEAATEAGRRRLRPIFLTTMAAAVGVTPMILSGSSLWGPLASVLAFGLVFSMFFTLLVVPVLYVVVRRRNVGPAGPAVAAVLVALVLAAAPATASAAVEEDRPITLEESLALLSANNRALRIARAKVDDARHELRAAKSDTLPHVDLEGAWLGLSDRDAVTVGRGELGTQPVIGPFPLGSITLEQGNVTLGSLVVTQPITQLLRVHEAVRAAEAGTGIARHEAAKLEDELRLAATQLYCGLLVARAQTVAAESAVTAAEAGVADAEHAVSAGATLEVALAGARATLLQRRLALAGARAQVDDLTEALDDLLGLPVGTRLAPAGVAPHETAPASRADLVRRALEANPELLAAQGQVARARAGLGAARDRYVPDLGAFALVGVEDGIAFVPKREVVYGLRLSLSLVDWGKRRSEVALRSSGLDQAEQNVARLRGRLAVDVGKAWRKLDTARLAWDTAREVRAVRAEAARLATNQLAAGTLSETKWKEADAALASAEADETAARLGVVLAQADLDRLTASR